MTPSGRPTIATRTPGSGSRASRRSHAKLGVKTVYDLSATPVLPGRLRLPRGHALPVGRVSDFSLIDAIESGIVKIPRVPVTTTPCAGDTVTYRNLWDAHRATSSRRRTGARPPSRRALASLLPGRARRARCTACTAATRRRFARWEASAAMSPDAAGDAARVHRRLPQHRRCRSSSSTGSPASRSRHPSRWRRAVLVARRAALFSNVVDGAWIAPAAHDPGRLRAARVRRGA